MEWLIAITTAANDPSTVLSAMQQDSWIMKNQRSRLLARIVELERRKAQGNATEEVYGLEYDESKLVNALLDEKKLSEARTELARIPDAKLKTSPWLDPELRLAEAEQRLPRLIAQWKKQPSIAPTSSDLQSAVHQLNAASTRIVMRFVYERALDERELTAPNFLGLAAIDLDEGDVPAAVSLLKRMTLISSNPYTDADSAASLLEAQHKFSDAIQFLQPLVQASPWIENVKIRLAVSMLAMDGRSQPALATLAAVAADPKATYEERLTAAKALKGHGAINSSTGSAELNLLARDGCPAEVEVSKPFFIQARSYAATCVLDKNARERLLLSAISASPSDTDLRLQYVSAAFEAGQNARALLASEPIIGSGSFYDQPYSQVNDSFENEGEQRKIPTFSKTNREQAFKLTWFAIHAREKRHEDDVALALVRSGLSGEQDSLRLGAFEDEKKRLETEASRIAENAARAPQIHNELAQDRVVRPRILTGEPFVPWNKVSNAEDAE